MSATITNVSGMKVSIGKIRFEPFDSKEVKDEKVVKTALSLGNWFSVSNLK